MAGGLKGIGGGNAGGPKKSTRTPRPIKPPGVYVNGKAVAKAVRQGTVAPATAPPPPPQQASLGIEPDALEEFKALAAAGGSPQYAEYLDFSVATRRGLEQELDTVLNALDAASRRQADLHARSADPQSIAGGNGYNENDATKDSGDQELLALLEARNADLETQLTQVWDELLVMDEGQKRLSRGVDDAERGALAAQDRAAKEIVKLRSELSGYAMVVQKLTSSAAYSASPSPIVLTRFRCALLNEPSYRGILLPLLLYFLCFFAKCVLWWRAAAANEFSGTLNSFVAHR